MIHGRLDDQRLRAVVRGWPVLAEVWDWYLGLRHQSRDGFFELNGPALYFNTHGYETRPVESCRWESHRFTADVQLCIEGGERIDWWSVPPAASSISYDREKDFEFWDIPGVRVSSVFLEPGQFVIFLPGELHRPMIRDGVHTVIRKSVAKIDTRVFGYSRMLDGATP